MFKWKNILFIIIMIKDIQKWIMKKNLNFKISWNCFKYKIKWKNVNKNLNWYNANESEFDNIKNIIEDYYK